MSIDTSTLPLAPAGAGFVIPGLPISATQSICQMPLRQMFQVMLDPLRVEKSKNPTEAERRTLELLRLIQRSSEGAKAKNIGPFSDYIVDHVRHPDAGVVPPVQAWTPDALRMVRLESPSDVAKVGLLLRYGSVLVPFDGGTQVAAWHRAASNLTPEELDGVTVAVVVHHGKPQGWARQSFYDSNVLGVKPNSAVAVSMDSRDSATNVAKRIIEDSALEFDQAKRQLGANSSAVTTISALRGGVVTSIFGMSGLQYGARGIEPFLPPGTDREAMEDALVEIWGTVLGLLEPALTARPATMAGAPIALAGIGGVLHHVFDFHEDLTSTTPLASEQVLSLLSTVEWRRRVGERFPWENVAGKVTERASGPVFAVAGPKESGYATYGALVSPESAAGRQIRS